MTCACGSGLPGCLCHRHSSRSFGDQMRGRSAVPWCHVPLTGPRAREEAPTAHCAGHAGGRAACPPHGHVAFRQQHAASPGPDAAPAPRCAAVKTAPHIRYDVQCLMVPQVCCHDDVTCIHACCHAHMLTTRQGRDTVKGVVMLPAGRLRHVATQRQLAGVAWRQPRRVACAVPAAHQFPAAGGHLSCYRCCIVLLRVQLSRFRDSSSVCGSLAA